MTKPRSRSAIQTAVLAVLSLVCWSARGLATNHSGTVASNQTWLAADNPHVVTGTLSVNSGVTLTLEAGVTVSVAGSSWFYVYGTLAAVGVPGTGIVFTRSGTSNWGGLYFSGAGAATLDHCTVEYASYGVYGSSSGSISIANSVVRHNTNGVYVSSGTLQLASTVLTNNTAYGFWGQGVAPVLLDGNVLFENCGIGFVVASVAGLSLTTPVTVRNNTTTGVKLISCPAATLDNLVLTGNTGTDGALLLEDSGEVTLGGGNTIGGIGLANRWPVSITAGSYPSATSVIPTTGNTNNNIRVSGGSSARTGVWRKFAGLDYVVDATTTIQAAGGLTIEDEVTVQAISGVWMYVFGTLTAVGTPGAGIVFTRSGTSNWGGLYFSGAGAATLDHCTVEYANYGVYATSSGTVSLANSVLSNNGYGIWGGSGTVALVRNQIVNNTTYGIHLTNAVPVFGASLSDWNDIHGNGSDSPGRDLHNGSADVAAPYVYWETMDWPVIETSIWDKQDDPALGRVSYVPFANMPHDAVVTAAPDHMAPTAPSARPNLFQNSPNPFNPSTTIGFELAEASRVDLSIYDLAGRLVRTLKRGEPMKAGAHRVVWDGRNGQGTPAASGTYLYSLESDTFASTRRMILLK